MWWTSGSRPSSSRTADDPPVPVAFERPPPDAPPAGAVIGVGPARPVRVSLAGERLREPRRPAVAAAEDPVAIRELPDPVKRRSTQVAHAFPGARRPARVLHAAYIPSMTPLFLLYARFAVQRGPRRGVVLERGVAHLTRGRVLPALIVWIVLPLERHRRLPTPLGTVLLPVFAVERGSTVGALPVGQEFVADDTGVDPESSTSVERSTTGRTVVHTTEWVRNPT